MNKDNKTTLGTTQARLIDRLGSDLTVANAARVSFAKSRDTLRDNDRKLIAFLAREGHWSPFGHVQLQFWCKAPIFIARQLMKHQVGLVCSTRVEDAAAGSNGAVVTAGSALAWAERRGAAPLLPPGCAFEAADARAIVAFGRRAAAGDPPALPLSASSPLASAASSR